MFCYVSQISLITACSSFLKQLYYTASESGSVTAVDNSWTALVGALAMASEKSRGILMLVMVQVELVQPQDYCSTFYKGLN
jgi:hypothetical protein